ncbi:hypothetical protein [Streptomyces sp. NBRC 110035]|uniref:hypothetical protein n=1 Tax=Streptomyces sp. NBRC 110035 TaxID=1547867 RepID=UPI0005A98943|nr:hypothetical protein [Streptomyces sp. NBRC 110035]
MTTDPTAALARIRQMADYWEQHLPEVIRTPAVVSALRAALEPVVPVSSPPADRAAPAPCTAYIENAHTYGRQHCVRPAEHTDSDAWPRPDHASPLIADAGIAGNAGRIYWDNTHVGAVPHQPDAPPAGQAAAVMGYVQGLMRDRSEGVPKDSQTMALVIDACFAFPDLYPTVNAEFAERRTTVEYYAQTQQPDGTWVDSTSRTTILEAAQSLLAGVRKRVPDTEHRLARRTTTVTIETRQDGAQR